MSNDSKKATLAKINNGNTEYIYPKTLADLVDYTPSMTVKDKLDSLTDNVNDIKITIDSKLNGTSTNPVQNKVITSELRNKSDLNHTHDKSTINITPEDIGAAPSDHTHDYATPTTAGFLSAKDKNKIDNIPLNAKYTDTTYDIATQTKDGLMSSTDKKKLDNIESGANKTIVDSALSSTSTNPVQNKVVKSALDGKSNTNHTHTISSLNISPSDIGASSTSHTHSNATTSAAGFLPKLGGGTDNYLRADGTWATPPNATYSEATTTKAGLMSVNDKKKLDGITIDSSLSSTSANPVENRVVKSALDGKSDNNHTHTISSLNITPSDIGASSTSHTHSNATTTTAGFMSSDDKKKLDNIIIDSQMSTTSTNPVQNKVIATAINNITSGISNVIVDSELSSTSENPVQNKVVKSALDRKSNTDHTHTISSLNISPSDIGASASFHTHSNATTSAAGFLPKLDGSTNKYLRSDGTWNSIPNATTSAAGLMSSEDKNKLDNIESGAGGGTVVIDDNLSDTSTNPVQNKVITAALNSITAGSGNITVDDGLSSTSTNPVQNKVIYKELKGCKQITDWNTATSTGWYMSYTCINGPSVNNHKYLGLVIEGSMGNGVMIQEVWDLSTMKKYSRTMVYADEDDFEGFIWDSWIAEQTNYSVATTTANGLMSSDDKKKLDDIIIDDELSDTSENSVQNKVITTAINSINNKVPTLLFGRYMGTSDYTTTNGNTYLILKYGSNLSCKYITGTGGTTVSSNNNGQLTIHSAVVNNGEFTPTVKSGTTTLTLSRGNSNNYYHYFQNGTSVYLDAVIAATIPTNHSLGTITITNLPLVCSKESNVHATVQVDSSSGDFQEYYFKITPGNSTLTWYGATPSGVHTKLFINLSGWYVC